MHYELCELLCPCSACPKNPRGEPRGESDYMAVGVRMMLFWFLLFCQLSIKIIFDNVI